MKNHFALLDLPLAFQLNIDKVVPMDDDIPRLRIFKKQLNQRYGPYLIHGDGNPMANVMIVAYEPGLDERIAHRGPQTEIVRGMIDGMGVPPTGCWYTYVLKENHGKLLTWPEVRPWSELFWEELGIIKPKATILLGVETAWAVLGLDDPDVEESRKKRFVHERAPFTNFFVTYSNGDASRYEVGSKFRGMLAQDIEAVFTVSKSYFTLVNI